VHEGRSRLFATLLARGLSVLQIWAQKSRPPLLSTKWAISCHLFGQEERVRPSFSDNNNNNNNNNKIIKKKVLYDLPESTRVAP
jgi:hypothetical protein